MEREQAAALLDQGAGSTAGRYAAVYDQHLEDRDYAACGRLTTADFQLASMASYWKTSAMPFAEYANLTVWTDRMMRIPAWVDPWPERGPPAARAGESTA